VGPAAPGKVSAGTREPGLVSVVVTVRNEGPNLGALLDSLLVQEPPFEVLIVDSNSEDDTVAIAERYAAHRKEVRVLVHGGTRGESRNFGVREAAGEWVAFIDGDCVASPPWLQELRAGLRKAPVAAGRTLQVGFAPWEDLGRVELPYKGVDVTHPSCNLAYRRDLFEALGGFDAWFRTAEDIDLNFRAVDRGARIGFVPEAVVFHRTRSTVGRFLKQAFWNGYGRKQLTLKHGSLWANYSLRRMFETQRGLWAWARLGVALAGYILAKVRERAPTPPAPPGSAASSAAGTARPEETSQAPERGE